MHLCFPVSGEDSFLFVLKQLEVCCFGSISFCCQGRGEFAF